MLTQDLNIEIYKNYQVSSYCVINCGKLSINKSSSGVLDALSQKSLKSFDERRLLRSVPFE